VESEEWRVEIGRALRGEGKNTPDKVWGEYEKGVEFKNQLNLYETVRCNENFYIGKQWEGVQSNGLPTPVFNFIKRIVLFLVASTATDNAKMSASPLLPAMPAQYGGRTLGAPAGAQRSGSGGERTSAGVSELSPLGGSEGYGGREDAEQICQVVNAQFEALFEQNKVSKLVRDFMRNAAVDGDACLYCWFDPQAETGQTARGTIRTELVENTRVIFGNPNSRRVQEQPWLIISRRERLEDVKRRCRAGGGEADQVRPDTDETNDRFEALADGKVTTLLKLWKDPDGGAVRAVESTKDAIIRREWDTGLKRYPVVWMNWDYVPSCYHGQAAVTGLIPNQIFVNKMFAMTMISLMTTAYPKVIYDRTRIARWDSGVGKAIGVDAGGGSLADAARTIDPAAISPQVSQFIELAVSMTKEFMGATDAAMGNVKPDNTSAIIALQKSSSVPLEIVKQDLYQAMEDMGNIWLDLMRAHYGVRWVELPPSEEEKRAAQLLGVQAKAQPKPFDFGVLSELPLSLKLDVGGSAYWSEIAQMNTLDNLLMQGKIDIVDYLERVPNGYISNQQELIETLKGRQAAALGTTGGAGPGGASMMQPGVESGIAQGWNGAEVPRELFQGMQTLERKAMEQGMETFAGGRR